MDKLTIEQKAQRYDEAKARMSRAWNDNRCTLGFMNEIFPELKESEDEKIRKWLIDTLMALDPASVSIKGIYEMLHPAISWLEKQGEHANFRNKIQIGDKVTRNEDGVLVNLSQLNRVAKKDEKQGETFTKKDVDDAYLKGICDAKHELEKQDGQNTVVVIPKFRVGDVIRPKGSTAEYTIESISGECYHGKGWGLHISCDNDYELVEQKPTWGEEDKKMSRFIGNAITADGASEYLESKGIQVIDAHVWLDKLKYRVQPQPRQGWSEEDTSLCARIQGILNVCKSHSLLSPDLYKEMCNWLKSLKERYTWKPSEEQMKALQESIGIVGELTIKGEYLKELFEDLKKLREG